MRETDFSKPNGAFEEIGSTLTFVPSNLPPQYDHGFIKDVLSEASKMLANLDEMTATVPPAFDLLFSAREALHSCFIDDVVSSMRQVFMRSVYQPGLETESSRLFTSEDQITMWHGIVGGNNTMRVYNCADAIRQCSKPTWIDGRIDEVKILFAHKLVMRREADYGRSTGRFKTDQNWIGFLERSITNATYVPPAPTRVANLVSDMSKFLIKNEDIPAPLLCAMAHHQFESIHPFAHGNGRVGRLLIQMILAVQGTLRRPMLCMSTFLLRNRTHYFKLLRDVNENSSWDAWFLFFLNGLKESCIESMALVGRLRDLYARYATLMGADMAHDFAVSLFTHPVTTTNIISTDLSISYDDAKMILTKAQDVGIVRPIEAIGGDGVYVADAILVEIS